MVRLLVTLAVLGILVLVVLTIIYLVNRRYRQEDIRAGRHHRGDLNRAQERQLQQDLTDAMVILRRLRRPPSSLDGEIILIPEDMGEAVDKLIARHERHQRGLPVGDPTNA